MFSLSYVDHPPLHYWMIKLASILFGSEQPIALRFPFILAFAGTNWLLFLITSNLFNTKAGFYAALALNLTAISSYMSFALLPDGPLMFFMLLALYVLIKLLFNSKWKNSVWLWLLFGLFTGLAMLSKYHGIFIFSGLFIFALTSKKWRYLFRSIPAYLSGIIAFLIFLPVLIWNMQHQWASFVFQGSRGLSNSFSITPLNLLANIAGQMGYVLPWIWLPMVYLLIRGFGNGPDNQTREVSEQNKTWLLCCMAIGPIFVFTLPTLWGCKGLPHWEFPGYLMLFPILGRWIEIQTADKKKWVNRCLVFSVAVIVFVWTFIVTQVNFDWISRINPSWFARKNPSQELLNWNDLSANIKEKNLIHQYNISFIVTTNWILAGRIDYAMGGGIPVLTLPNNQHNFALMHDQSKFIGDNALIILPKNKSKEVTGYSEYFKSITPLESLFIFHSLVNKMEINIFLAKEYKGYSN